VWVISSGSIARMAGRSRTSLTPCVSAADWRAAMLGWSNPPEARLGRPSDRQGTKLWQPAIFERLRCCARG